MIRPVITRTLQVIATVAVIVAIGRGAGWLAETDAQVDRASLLAYCESVAVWSAEASRGIAPERRTGHPDFHNKAADVCPGMRPAGPANSSESLTGSRHMELAQQ